MKKTNCYNLNPPYINIQEIGFVTLPPSPGYASATFVAANRVSSQSSQINITGITHPEYAECEMDWDKWRAVYEGGQTFIDSYVKKFSNRESEQDFILRKEMAPIPAFAKAAVNDVKNAIYERSIDITRTGGPTTYQNAIKGKGFGVDLKSSSMNWFVGNKILPELLVMKKVGIFVDMPTLPDNASIADAQGKQPYIYIYRAEDIRSWSIASENSSDFFTSLLLRAHIYTSDPQTGLPLGCEAEYRQFFIAEDRKVHLRVFGEDGKLKSDEKILNISKIPFIVCEISNSLLADVANHQIALANMESSDITFVLKSNFPFYTEQFDPTASNKWLKQAQVDTLNDQGRTIDPKITSINDQTSEIEVGVTHGRQYPKGMDRPEFIAPPSEPLEASMKKQDQMKDDIRKLINLAVSSVNPKMASAESKSIDQQGLEAGLAYIGLELERAERLIGILWSMYEGSQDAPTIKYPQRYSLKSDEDRRKEINELSEIINEISSNTLRKEIAKQIATLTIGNRVTDSILTKIYQEIEAAQVVSSNPDVITQSVELGLLDNTSGALALGYPEDVVKKAEADHAARLARIAKSQMDGQQLTNAGSRGVKDLATDSNQSAKEKKGKKKRGEAQ